ncbi:MAG: pyrroline-5-carboxylate reductase family protein, partial [Pyrinomonadaceae bacterium]
MGQPQSEIIHLSEHLNPLRATHLSFIGCGVMAEAIIAGLLRNRLVTPEQITASHPRMNRREELAARYNINALESNRAAARISESTTDSIVTLAVKPQRLNGILSELKGMLHQDQMVVSVVAGARLAIIAESLLHSSVVRAMPNTPAQIGQGTTVWTSTQAVSSVQHAQVQAMFGALGFQ